MSPGLSLTYDKIGGIMITDRMTDLEIAEIMQKEANLVAEKSDYHTKKILSRTSTNKVMFKHLYRNGKYQVFKILYNYNGNEYVFQGMSRLVGKSSYVLNLNRYLRLWKDNNFYYYFLEISSISSANDDGYYELDMKEGTRVVELDYKEDIDEKIWHVVKIGPHFVRRFKERCGFDTSKAMEKYETDLLGLIFMEIEDVVKTYGLDNSLTLEYWLNRMKIENPEQYKKATEYYKKELEAYQGSYVFSTQHGMIILTIEDDGKVVNYRTFIGNQDLKGKQAEFLQEQKEILLQQQGFYETKYKIKEKDLD